MDDFKLNPETMRVLAQIEEARKVMDSTVIRMSPAIQSILEIQRRANSIVQNFVLSPEMQRLGEQVQAARRIFANAAMQVSPVIESILEFQRRLAPTVRTFMDVVEAARRYPKLVRSALQGLGENGWYPDLEMPLTSLVELGNALATGIVEEAEEALVSHFRRRCTEISVSLGAAMPSRDKVLRAAFGAHARGEYDLSIPVFLAQADGACWDLIGIHLYKINGNEKRPATAKFVDSVQKDDEFGAALMYPLELMLPISYSSRDRGPDFDGLNRHQVLHGESVNYGTEKNSLRAISLLNYIAQILKRAEQEERDA